MQVIELGRFKIEVCVSNGVRMVKHSDVKELLDLKDDEVSKYFIDAGIVSEILFKKIYIDKNATKEQEIIYKGLCIVGIYPLIDEVCQIDLKNISYTKEFNGMTSNFSALLENLDINVITIDNPVEINITRDKNSIAL